MTSSLHSLLLAINMAAPPAKKTSSGGSAFTIVFLVLIVAVFYLLIIRPRKARMKQQQVQTKSLDIGVEVMSVGGIMGTIVGMSDTAFDVEVSPGVVLTFVRRAVNPRPATAETVTSQDDEEEEGDMPADPWDEPPATTDDYHEEIPDDEPPEHDSGEHPPEHGSPHAEGPEVGEAEIEHDHDRPIAGAGPDVASNGTPEKGKSEHPASEGETDSGSGGFGTGRS